MMSNNQDDFDTDDDFESDLDAEFEDFGGGSDRTLGDLWNNPAVKIGSILGGFLIVVGSIILFGGGDERTPQSRVTAPPEMNQSPGEEKLSPEMTGVIEDYNIDQAREAERTGETVMPIPTEPAREQLSETVQEEPQEDPLERWQRLQEQRAQTRPEPDPQPAPRQQGPSEAQQQRSQAINNLSKRMAEQMGSILDSRSIDSMSHTVVPLSQPQQQAAQAQQGAGGAAGAPGQQQQEPPKVLLRAGEIEYGQLLVEANTDAPGPILAQIASGPFAGGRLIGSFEATDNFLVLRFNTLSHDDETYQVQVVALNPDTTLSGLATEIDRRYFQRVILPAAASFIEGVGEAISDDAETNVTVSGDTVIEEQDELDPEQEIAAGIEEAGQEIGDMLDERANEIETLIRVEAGTPLGLFFIAPVTENNSGFTPSPGFTSPGGTSGTAGATANAQPAPAAQREDSLDSLDFLQQLQNP